MTEQQIVSAYFTYCKLQKNLDNKTLKAYQIDLKQFLAFYQNQQRSRVPIWNYTLNILWNVTSRLQ